LCIIHENGNDVIIETSKGNYILNKDVQEIVLVYNGYWSIIFSGNDSIPHENHTSQTISSIPLIPYVDHSYKQDTTLNLYNLSKIGENFIVHYDRGNTSQNGRYKMSNLIFVSASNYHGRTSSYDGEGAVLVFRISNGRYFSNSVITEGFDLERGIYQGTFGKQVKVLDMGLYDLLVVTAPVKVRDNSMYRTVLDDVFGYIYIYSYRKNEQNDFYFHRETKIPLPSMRITKDLSTDVIDDYLPHNTIFQMETLRMRGVLISYMTKILYFYNFVDLNNITTQTNNILNPEFIKIVGNKIYLSYDNEIKMIQYSSNIWTDPISTILTNTYQVEDFGRIVYPYNQGIVVISMNDLFDFDLSYQLKKRITFGADIISFDLFEDASTRKYFVLIDGTDENVYVFDKNYNLILNDLYNTFVDDDATLIRSDISGETIFICAPNHTDVDNGIKEVGIASNYDVFFERENKNLSSLFPDFNIYNQILIEEKSLNHQKYFYLEENFKNQIDLISNRGNNRKNVETIYPVIHDTGITLELNYDVSYGSFLSSYAKYFIYTNPVHGSKEYSYILNNSNLYLGWTDNQMLSYNNSDENEIHLYKENNKIHLVMLGVGTQSGSLVSSNKRWNVVRSEMLTDMSKNSYDISMSSYGSLDMLQFVRFNKFTHNSDLVFLVHNLYSVQIIDYFTGNVYTKTFTRNTSEDLFYMDSFKNLFHLYPEIDISTSIITCRLNIYKAGNYNLSFLDSVKMDFTTMPYEFAAQYYDRAFVLVENRDNVVEVRRFDINQDLPEKIEFEEVNISNEFKSEKHIVDIEFSRDTVKKVVFVNREEKEDKIFQKKSQKIYTLPRLLFTNYKSFEKKDVRQLMVKERHYVNYDLYQIKDEVPNLFYNIDFQKYFKNNLGIYSNYEFYDNKDIIDFEEDKSLVLHKQNMRSISRYTFRPDKDYEIKTYLYDKENHSVIITAKRMIPGITGASYVEIFDVSSTSYVILESGANTGVTIQKKYFDKEICYETLDNRGRYYISEEYDEQSQSIHFWTFTKSTNYTPTMTSIPITLDTTRDTCFYRSPNDEFFLDTLISNKIVYFRKSGSIYVQQNIDIPSTVTIHEPFDIQIISEDFFAVIDKKDKNYLFVKNQTTNLWRYMGQQIEKLKTNHIDTFELGRFYYVDIDVSNNYQDLLLNTNINIQSPIYSDADKRFYCIQPTGIYKLSHPNLSQLQQYHSISSDGSTIYTQNQSGTVKKLIYFDHADKLVSSDYVSTSSFHPSAYTDYVVDISWNGYFTLINNTLGFSKSYLFQPTISRKFNTKEYPLIDVYNNVYVYEKPILSQYKLQSNQYLMDGSRNLTNFEMWIDDDEKMFVNSNFGIITYNEIVFSSRKQLLNSFISDIPFDVYISPDASDFLVYQYHSLHLVKENTINYPNKYKLYKTLIPSNYLKTKLDINKIPTETKIDWNNNRIFNAYGYANLKSGGTGSAGATGPSLPRISILTWSPNGTEFDYHSDLSGGQSFGYTIQISNDGRSLFVGEPRAPASDGYQEGKIHIYQYNDIQNRFVLWKTLRSQRSKIGYLMKVSASMDRIATYGYLQGIEELELVIFYNINDTPEEISMKANVYDMTFLGTSNTLFVEEKIFYQNTNEKRTFYLIEDINGCPNIITKVIFPNLLFNDDRIMYELIPFGMNYILFNGDTISHIIQIKDYKMIYIATQTRSERSKVAISNQGNTLVSCYETTGKLSMDITW
jgi:hypothetical protein